MNPLDKPSPLSALEAFENVLQGKPNLIYHIHDVSSKRKSVIFVFHTKKAICLIKCLRFEMVRASDNGPVGNKA